MIVMIDNYDSFTYTIVHYLQALGVDVCVVRNDELSVDEVVTLAPSAVVISPGPCTPRESGISLGVISAFAGVVPILGVCLGHQAIAHYFGGAVVKAPTVYHGKTSPIHHNGAGLFDGLPMPLDAMRYHSLVVDQETLPDCLEVTAWTEPSPEHPSVIMGLRHRVWPIEGVQFHPESILTEHGSELFSHFLAGTAVRCDVFE